VLVSGVAGASLLHSWWLKGADLSRAILDEADLSQANLNKANLFGASLDKVNLRQASLWEADLREARLIETTLSGTDVGAANLKDAFIGGTDLSMVINLTQWQINAAEGDAETKLPGRFPGLPESPSSFPESSTEPAGGPPFPSAHPCHSAEDARGSLQSQPGGS